MPQIINKKVKLQLVGLDGNDFAILGAFQKQTKKEGWAKDEISKVVNKAMEGDYNHLLSTIMTHCDDDYITDGNKVLQNGDYDTDYEEDYS